MQAAILILILVLWILGTAATYRVCRKMNENSAFADFFGCLFFWWMVLPFFSARVGWLAGQHYAAVLIAWAERRKQLPQSGAANGLYE